MLPPTPPVGDRLRFTTIAHGGRSVLGPVSSERLDALVEALPLAPGARIVELGSGKAELLVRLLRRWPGTSAEGFDRNPWFIADARVAAAAAGVASRLSLIDTDSPGTMLSGRAVDLAIAVGATGIVGEGAETLAFLASIVVPGGQVVFGDGLWVGEPDQAGLAAFGMSRAELSEGVDAFADQGRALGLEVLSVDLVSIDEWDAYESAYASGVDRWAASNPKDPDHAAFTTRAAGMRASYAAWRRASMGFAIGVFRRGEPRGGPTR